MGGKGGAGDDGLFRAHADILWRRVRQHLLFCGHPVDATSPPTWGRSTRSVAALPRFPRAAKSEPCTSSGGGPKCGPKWSILGSGLLSRIGTSRAGLLATLSGQTEQLRKAPACLDGHFQGLSLQL